MRRRYLPLLASLTLLTGCTLVGAPGGDRPPAPTPTAAPDVPSPQILAADVARRKVATPGLNTLGFNVFRRVEADHPTDNLACSPASLGRALLMAYAGARGGTREAMATALGMPDQSEATLESYAAATGPSLDKRGVAIQIANSAWVKDGFAIQPTYLDLLRRYFLAEVTPFSSATDATLKLQDWIKRKSNNLLDGQGFQVPGDIVLLLADVLTFDGRWNDVFNRAETQMRPFHTAPTTSQQVPIMHRAGHYFYGESEGYQVIRLPYDKGVYSMYVLMATDSATESLDADRFQRLVGRTKLSDGEILLPRFSMKGQLPLTEPLRAAGLDVAFTDAADFGGMAPGLKLNQIDQEIRVAVDEEGTVAAAATVVGAVAGAVSALPPFHMEVNRPFYFVVRDDSTGGVLFMGKVTHPE